jgi:hypothetical protein
MSDIEAKVTRVGASKPGGERVSIKKELRALGNSTNESIIYEAVLGSLRNGFGGHELCLR